MGAYALPAAPQFGFNKDREEVALQSLRRKLQMKHSI